MALYPQELGSYTTGAINMPAPTSDTDGYATYGARYVNLWAQASGASTERWQLQTYVYRTGIGWVRYSEGFTNVPNVFAVPNGFLAELEVRGVERVYFRRTGTASPNSASATVMVEGFTYR